MTYKLTVKPNLWPKFRIGDFHFQIESRWIKGFQIGACYFDGCFPKNPTAYSSVWFSLGFVAIGIVNTAGKLGKHKWWSMSTDEIQNVCDHVNNENGLQ